MYPSNVPLRPRAPYVLPSQPQAPTQQTANRTATTTVTLTTSSPRPHNTGQDENFDLREGIDAGDPLTAKGRVKKRLREKDSFDPDDPDRYRYKAYHIRRAFDLFGHIPTIINDGIKRRAKEAAGEDTSIIQTDQDYETFNLIVDHLDGLNDDFVRLKRSPKEFRALIRKIREAADQARNNDTANLKKDIACMLTPDVSSVLSALVKGRKASSKHDRGFDNDVMGRYLCPISLDWDDLAVRSEIKEGKHAILACDWPRLLYADCNCNLDDLEQGLGRNMALVRVVKYLFTGRSAAFSETAGGKTTRSGNAALAGMKQITPRVVAYSACMLRYAISNEESWSTMDREFNMHEFYWHVVSIFDDSDDFGKELLAWFNMKVFGISLNTTMKPHTPAATAALSVLRSQRQAKRDARRVLGDISNNRDSQRMRQSSMEPESEDELPENSNQQRAQVEQDAPHETQTESNFRSSVSAALGTDTQVPQMNPAAWTPESSFQDCIGTRNTRHSSVATGTPQTSVHYPQPGSMASQNNPQSQPDASSLHVVSCYAQEGARSPSTFYVRPDDPPSSHGFAQSSQNHGTSSRSYASHSSTYRDPAYAHLLAGHAHGASTVTEPASPAMKTYTSRRPPAPPWSYSTNAKSNSCSVDTSVALSLSKPSSTLNNGANANESPGA